MTDQELIKREDALAACDIGPCSEWTDYTKDGYSLAADDCKRGIAALPAIDPAAIREAAWVEALDAAHEYTLIQYGMGFLQHPVDRERILALIGKKK